MVHVEHHVAILAFLDVRVYFVYFALQGAWVSGDTVRLWEKHGFVFGAFAALVV